MNEVRKLSMTDEELIKQISLRNQEVYEEMIHKYSKFLWAVTFSVMSQGMPQAKMNAEEIISDVFFRLWQHPEKYDAHRGTLKSYLALMTRSLTLNKLKQFKFEGTIEEINEPDEAEISIETKESVQMLFDFIMELEEPSRTILIERFFFESKPAEIQQKMGIPLKVINNRLYKGRKKLQKQMKQARGEKTIGEA